MELDIATLVGAIDRKIVEREHEGKPARAIVASRAYPAAIEDVWDALTNVERIPRWFTPISGDLRLGGRYQLEGNAGGTITACEPPKTLAATWEYGEEVSWVQVRLEAESADRTRLHLEHTAYVDDERWAQFGPGAVGIGWDLSFWGLQHYLATGQSVPPEEVTAPSGIEFMTGSNDGWAEASIAAGTPEVAAREAAARTLAFYTGAEEPGSS